MLAGSVSDDDVSKPSKGEVDEWSLIQMAGRMEIISIHDISLAKFLGSGGYGEVCCPLGSAWVMIEVPLLHYVQKPWRR